MMDLLDIERIKEIFNEVGLNVEKRQTPIEHAELDEIVNKVMCGFAFLNIATDCVSKITMSNTSQQTNICASTCDLLVA